jgi:hypothetical protein
MSGAMAFAGAAAASGSSSTITAAATVATDLSVSSSSAGIRYNPNGSYERVIGGSPSFQGFWVSPTTAGSEWEIRATVASGVTPSGTVNAWLALSSSRTWGLSVTGSGTSETCNLTLEFRRVGGSTAEVTVTDNIIQAEVL